MASSIMNYSKVSPWYGSSELDQLILMAAPGDRLEFNRGIYNHWAVYVGLQDLPDSFGPIECVVHRANNTIGSSAMVSKQHYGTGDVTIEALKEVVASSRVRINNSKDSSSCLPSDVVVRRVLSSLDKRASASQPCGGTYNLVTNNCEHLATWARNDTKSSDQVDEVVKAVGTGVLVGAGVLAVGAIIGALVSESRENKGKEATEEGDSSDDDDYYYSNTRAYNSRRLTRY